MSFEVLNYVDFSWVAQFGGANLWSAETGETKAFFLQPGSFNFSWACWAFCFEPGRVRLITSRKGQPIIQIFVTDVEDALTVCRVTFEKIKQQRAELRFFVGHGWSA